MGRSYYYFAASLPMALWDGKLPLTTEEFCSAARRLLSAKDGLLIEKLLNGQDEAIETDNAAANGWIRFNRNFRNEIAALRAQRAHKDPRKAVRGVKDNEPALREAVQEALKRTDLLEAEKSMDKIFWQFLEELSAGHYYDLEFLIGYGLKLKILERHQTYRSSKGREAFERIKAMELPLDWAVSGI